MLKAIFVVLFGICYIGLNTKIEAKELEPVHYAYSNYLGSGIYHTTGQDVTLISLPFSVELGREDRSHL